jgi:hypothetical protein
MTSNDEDRFRVVEPDNIERPPHYREGRTQMLTGDTGRQGPSGRRVLVVLVLSLIAILLIWAANGMLHWW